MYTESEPHPDINRLKSSISIIPISPFPKILQTSSKLLFPILAPLKVIWQVLSLYYTLSYTTPASKWMLVQNPPSIPTLAITQLVCFLRNTRLVIDWHNFGYSILALKLGPAHPLVRISRWYERFFARGADVHFTVTKAMARVLKDGFEVEALPLHDRPPEHFQPLNSTERSTFLRHLPETSEHAGAILSGKTKLIISSTSWTPDEDFSLLLDALVSYSTSATERTPRILAIITGKGPQKTHYLSRISTLKSSGRLSHVDIKTAFLPMADYASLLGAADVGISLHTSSSGVDLPMKVVDMFGTGLPVFGWSNFEAWPELVVEGVNGRGFGSADELAGLLVEHFSGSEGGMKLKNLREGAMRETGRRWDGEWESVAGRVLGFGAQS
jgi:beta-1,4-mannosyltransferase